LSRAAQADQPSIFGGPATRLRQIAALISACMALSACGGGGFSLEKAEVDRSFYTSNVPAQGGSVDLERLSDEATIRNAVTSADLELLAGSSLSWANAGTGARGEITGIAEFRKQGALCRRFSASRENFDGVAMFKGEACMVGSGAWRMESFQNL
jgi:hypothetical protein